MGEHEDVSASDCFISCGNRCRASVSSRIDREEFPPRNVRDGPIFVILNIIFYQDFRFIYIMSLAPPG